MSIVPNGSCVADGHCILELARYGSRAASTRQRLLQDVLLLAFYRDLLNVVRAAKRGDRQ